MKKFDIARALFNGWVVMKPMYPPKYRWEMERPNFFACGPLRETESEAKEDLEKFQLIIELGIKQTEPI